MAAGEVTVTCAGCGSAARLPIAAVRRGNSYCSRCGKVLPMDNVRYNTAEENAPSQAKRRPYKSTRRR